MNIQWVRGICAALILGVITAGISYRVIDAERSERRSGAVMVMAYPCGPERTARGRENS